MTRDHTNAIEKRTIHKEDWEPGVTFFVTAHGLGHAARAVAIMAALRAIAPRLRIDVFTTIPAPFFLDSVPEGLFTHTLTTDVGLVQDTPLHADLNRTLKSLDQFLPFSPPLIEQTAEQIRNLNSRLIVCDIAPLGIAVAKHLGIPSVLVENFTWDWIYEGYAAEAPDLKPHIDYLRNWFHLADYHIQTEPVSVPTESDLTVPPVCRNIREDADTIREKLTLPDGTHAVLVTMGGIPDPCRFAHKLANFAPVHFVIPVGDASPEPPPNVRFLIHGGGFHHPDVVNACDAVVAKLGYSTLAEVWHSGVPLAYIKRPGFREGNVLEHFVTRHIQHVAVDNADFANGAWLKRLPELLALPRVERISENGADAAATFLLAHTD
ncbi:MAG: hypothetical protein ISS35_01410 [Kiritimatiellae bacterium]|nr:hypothetical protein [Kiritimatiellia bacterium]